MANKLVEQRLTDSTKRSIIKYVLVGDGSALANTVMIDVSTLAYALNTNGMIMSSNVHLKPIYKTAIKRIAGQIGGAATSGIKLSWHRVAGTIDSEIVTLGTGSFDIDFKSMGDGSVIINPDTNSANSNGDIIISSVGTAPNTMTLLVYIEKFNDDYDAGQTADPMAFNKGSRGM